MPVTIDGTLGITSPGGDTNVSTTSSGVSTAARFIPSGSTVPTNGVYLPAANTVGISTNSTAALTVDSSQNVGIGTASPSYKLEVQGSANTYFGQRIYNTSTGSSAVSYLQIGNNTSGATAQLGLNSSANTTNFGGANALYLVNGLSAPLVLGVNNAELMRLVPGSVLVGRTTAYSDGSIGQGGLQTQSVSGARIGMACIADITGSQGVIGFVNPNGSVGSVSTNGSNTAFNTTSDYRLKENVTPIANALETVAKLKPVDYTWKIDNTKGQGFIAHELQEVCPQAVTGTKDGVDKEGKPIHQSVDTSFLVGMLTAAIQELNAKVDAQAAEIAALKAGA
jgi:hypothetical protein